MVSRRCDLEHGHHGVVADFYRSIGSIEVQALPIHEALRAVPARTSEGVWI
jgi:hypothetical protein